MFCNIISCNDNTSKSSKSIRSTLRLKQTNKQVLRNFKI